MKKKDDIHILIYVVSSECCDLEKGCVNLFPGRKGDSLKSPKKRKNEKQFVLGRSLETPLDVFTQKGALKLKFKFKKFLILERDESFF